MEKKSLIVNTGSDSHKYAIYAQEKELFFVHLEKEAGAFVAALRGAWGTEKYILTKEEYASPVAFFLKIAQARGVLYLLDEITSVGVRIVAPGDTFLEHSVITPLYLKELQEAQTFAPLHSGLVLQEIEELNKLLPDVPLFGISDSAFHASLPDVARNYALPEKDRIELGIKRFGYHGISVASIVEKVKKTQGAIPSRVIVCHLGSGSSITALKDGVSIDTSMGLTPLEGLPMGTRVGNIDPGAVIALAHKKGLSLVRTKEYLTTKSGLLGLSGATQDIRELIELEKSGHPGATLALAMLVYSFKKYIGAYTAILGGLDLLVFTATIGERSSIMRERMCDGLETLGIALDSKKNSTTIATDGFIHKEQSPVRIAVMTTNEMDQMARELARI